MGRAVLAVGLGRELERLQPLLSRREFTVERLPRGQRALALADSAAFDFIIVGHPLADIALDVFLRELRQAGSPCQGSELLVVSDPARIGEIASLVAAARGTVCPREPPRRLVDEVACRVLGVSPRLGAGLLVKIRAMLGTPVNRIVCQMVNLSMAGVLLRTDRPHPVGTRLRFEIGLPEDARPLQGEAEVVRQAAAALEGVEGMALRFEHFTEDGRARLQHFLGRPTGSDPGKKP